MAADYESLIPRAIAAEVIESVATESLLGDGKREVDRSIALARISA